MESGVEFVACDMPQADRTTIQILAAVAEGESERGKVRCREAWKARKARGWQFNGTMPTNGPIANKQRANVLRSTVSPIVESLRAKGLSLLQIAHNLNGQGLRTRQNKSFTTTAVWRILNGATGGAVGRF